MELGGYQEILPEIHSKGAQLVAISPELPDNSLSLSEKLELDFEILSDLNNEIAKKFGIVFELSDELKPLYEKFGVDLPKTQGNKNFELPVPATYVVDGDGTIILAHLDIDYTRRLEPEEVLEVL
ncbi:peroxiredoxin-like family protein [Oceanirhabdus sp. W0125-5]|uniref:peroxiredoxin-like family protein n=1 Tax=Oceanirhabdus sp. W0125-5 TaxID=2999116 RepID=UPI002FDF0811